MNNLFSAAPQALGYLFQTIRYSLYVMMVNLDRRDCHLRMEKFDDIEIVEGATPRDSIQVKQTATNLTNRSTDFWKTIRVWSDNLQTGKLHLPGTILTIATTAKAPENSIPSLLRPSSCQPALALKLMLAETENPTDSLSTEFAAFRSLSSKQQKLLVDSIEIHDLIPDIENVDEKTKALFHAVHPENRDLVYDRLQGWWVNQVVSHLRSNSETELRVSSVQTKLAEINDGIKSRTLQDPFLDETLPINYDWDKRTFVLQLRLIDLNPQLRKMAIRDYYHATRLRNWLVDEVHVEELTTYNEKLKEEWKYCFLGNEVPEDMVSNEVAKQEIGRTIYNQVIRNINIPIHRDLTDIQITRGSYHILADMRDNLEVGWHPNFKEAILNLLTDED